MRKPNFKKVLEAIAMARQGETHPSALPPGATPGGLPPASPRMNQVAPPQSPPTHIDGDFVHAMTPRGVPR